jgi:hypothetical protein
MHQIKAPQFQHVRALSNWVWPVHRYKAHSFTFYCHWEYLKIATSCSWRNPLHKNLKVPLYKVPGYMLSNMLKFVCLLESKTSLHHIRHLHKRLYEPGNLEHFFLLVQELGTANCTWADNMRCWTYSFAERWPKAVSVSYTSL